MSYNIQALEDAANTFDLPPEMLKIPTVTRVTGHEQIS